MNKLWIVIKHVYRKNVARKAFIWMLFSPIITLAICLAIGFFIGKYEGEKTATVALVDAPTTLQEKFQADAGKNTIRTDLDENQTKEALKTDSIDGYLVLTSKDKGLNPTFYNKTNSKDISLKPFENLLNDFILEQNISKLRLDPQQFKAIAHPQVPIQSVSFNYKNGELVPEIKEMKEVFIRKGIAYLTCFMFIFSYVSVIGQEIASEKGSKVCEIILSSIPAKAYFFGKLSAIGLMVVTQIIIYLLIGGLVWMGFHLDLFSLPSEWTELLAQIHFSQVLQESLPSLLLGIVYAVLGIIIYSRLAAFLGSLISKTEELPKAMIPISMLGVIGFYIGMFAMTSTNNTFVRIASQIPSFTPFVMPFRLSNASIQPLEITLSIVLCFIFAIVILTLSVTFYKSNILTTSDKGFIDAMKRSLTLWKTEK